MVREYPSSFTGHVDSTGADFPSSYVICAFICNIHIAASGHLRRLRHSQVCVLANSSTYDPQYWDQGWMLDLVVNPGHQAVYTGLHMFWSMDIPSSQNSRDGVVCGPLWRSRVPHSLPPQPQFASRTDRWSAVSPWHVLGLRITG